MAWRPRTRPAGATRTRRSALTPWATPVVLLVALAGSSSRWGLRGAVLSAAMAAAFSLGWILGAGLTTRAPSHGHEKPNPTPADSGTQSSNFTSTSHLSESPAPDAIIAKWRIPEGDDLAKADLEGAELVGADLEGADLTGADLSHLDLRGVNLRGAILRDANLRGARLGIQPDEKAT